ncbi:hypothetical protein ABT337_11975 [Saccharopolyspora hirsuta]|uniref:LppX_LprAFG lipoprotein n=1 Tax=Saccharopolyspora hirsuta TaxID=1837 RepID=A0A5M7BXQ1_SACHI|nr:hypothetical protein [Saccharopolyspora hirsuta]KAA5832878.1 hypothetical protein F1721_18105 [Saccharopolyspora hirsuta]
MRRIATALSAAALAATLGACSQGGSPTGSDNAGDNSGSAITDISSLVNAAKTNMDEKKTVTVTFEGTGPIAQLYTSMKCQVDAAAEAMGCSGGPTEMVVSKDGIFMKSPEMAQLAGGDPSKPWLKMPANEEVAQQFGELGKISDFEAMLPPGSTITSSAEEQVNGKDATRYEVTTNLQEAAGAATTDAQKAGFKVMLDSGVTEIKQTVWVDSDKLPLQVKMTTPALKVQGQEIPETTLTVHYSDWGKPVNITTPPADQVQEMPSLPGMPG